MWTFSWEKNGGDRPVLIGNEHQSIQSIFLKTNRLGAKSNKYDGREQHWIEKVSNIDRYCSLSTVAFMMVVSE